ncbi:hypothetical protein NLJ89_g4568 [Agrocybe chaxingu]|uniref:RING-type domain-containing protein n=1 Tax=Agrocybe chaxingu TaxID=84603 RepID=A0A9W8K9I9_9AGAR|nr:hypothetical protein NLJ89_g4568 [Agrocybe chaxingu]
MDDGHQHHEPEHRDPEHIRAMINELEPLVLEMLSEQQHILAGQLSSGQIKSLLDGLPQVDEKKIVELGEKDSTCPICFTPYLAIIAEEELALAMDSPARPIEELGVTKLSQPWQCNHMFCKRDISKWIIGGHDSCPLCRRLLVEKQEDPPERELTSDDESEPRSWARSLSEPYEPLRARQAGTLNINGFEFTTMGLGPTGLPNRPRNDDHNDARREYAGMYS